MTCMVGDVTHCALLNELLSVDHVTGNVLYESRSFGFVQNLRPENTCLRKVVVIRRVPPEHTITFSRDVTRNFGTRFGKSLHAYRAMSPTGHFSLYSEYCLLSSGPLKLFG